jgi:hypothetical protein
MKWCILLVLVCALNANPVIVEVMNEFQVAPYDSERVELRYLRSSALDTVFINTFPLYNNTISTPAGIATIDTNIALINMEQIVIDRSVLSGNFGLPDDSGFISLVEWFDSLDYPGPVTVWQYAPAPPAFWSAAKFHCYMFRSDYFEYWLISDWYVDSTPTFGLPNDDYSGCFASGCVYGLYNQPLAGACVAATVVDDGFSLFPPLPYHTCCTTFTAVDGSYSFDSLLPYSYDIQVSATGYVPDTQYWVGPMCNTAPITNVDFFLQPGITENQKYEILMGSFVRPNPFHNAFHLTMHEPLQFIEIYDVTGKLMRRVDNQSLSTDVTVDGADLPRGIYFIAVRGQKLKVIKL